MYPHLNGKVTPKSLPPIKSNVHPQNFHTPKKMETAPKKMETTPKSWDHAPN
jgi:hypothetical protein